MYHYVRDLPRTRYPRIKGLLIDEFHAQVKWLSSEFEMVSLEAAIEFLEGRYHPRRDLCMLSFDDGLKEHHSDVMPILAERNIQGIFGIITGCVEQGVVAPVHMNHFLTATLDFDEYQKAFLDEIENVSPGLLDQVAVDSDEAQRSYPLDTREMATFKLLVNFRLHPGLRDGVIRRLFERYCGHERPFANELYMNWQEIRQLQQAGMLIAGHTHSHQPLSTMNAEELAYDVRTCRGALEQHIIPQELWPFSYPYGKRNSYSPAAIEALQHAGYVCAFGTEAGRNVDGTDLFELYRVDCKGVVENLSRGLLTAR